VSVFTLPERGSASAGESSLTGLPLVVDVDGTLTQSDLLC
jgi:hypothetical protein